MSKIRYDKEFKQEAVKLCEEAGVPTASKQLGVSRNTLYTWIRRNNESTPNYATSEEVKLRKEVRELKKANEILKAALGFFAEDQKR